MIYFCDLKKNVIRFRIWFLTCSWILKAKKGVQMIDSIGVGRSIRREENQVSRNKFAWETNTFRAMYFSLLFTNLILLMKNLCYLAMC